MGLLFFSEISYNALNFFIYFIMSQEHLISLLKTHAVEEDVIAFTLNHLSPELFLSTKKNNALFLAVSCNFIHFIDVMLQEHKKNPKLFDLNFQNGQGNNLFMSALKAEAKGISLKLIEYHLHHPESFDINIRNKEGESALHLLLTYPHFQSVELLEKILQSSTLNVNLKNNDGLDAFNAMCSKIRYQNKEESTDSLVNLLHAIVSYNQKTKRFDLNSEDSAGNSAFLHACSSQASLCHSMLNYPDVFNFYQKNNLGFNALSIAYYPSFVLLLQKKEFHQVSFLEQSLNSMKDGHINQKAIENLLNITQIEAEKNVLNQSLIELKNSHIKLKL
jgi:hypothetical protein